MKFNDELVKLIQAKSLQAASKVLEINDTYGVTKQLGQEVASKVLERIWRYYEEGKFGPEKQNENYYYIMCKNMVHSQITAYKANKRTMFLDCNHVPIVEEISDNAEEKSDLNHKTNIKTVIETNYDEDYDEAIEYNDYIEEHLQHIEDVIKHSKYLTNKDVEVWKAKYDPDINLKEYVKEKGIKMHTQKIAKVNNVINHEWKKKKNKK